ncbi:hypothetical protein [Bacillus xiapuensis]|uniref:hypothetical protein n=1 Tax=Bacillus xiapuensis TaxID=2014075 RepID=UPI0018E24021|nr:hypothetical protein [Bacillus xiapuensis]
MVIALIVLMSADNKANMYKLNNQNFFGEFCQAIADGIACAVGIAPKQHKPCFCCKQTKQKRGARQIV